MTNTSCSGEKEYKDITGDHHKPNLTDYPKYITGDHKPNLTDYPKEEHNNFINKFMGTLIIALLAITLLSILLHMYVRCLLRRHARRRATVLQLQRQVAALNSHSREPPNTGLDPSVIVSLPLYPYKKSTQVDENETIDCAVCLNTLEEKEIVRVLPNCAHTFHVQCIDMWLSSNLTCPICRAAAKPGVPPEITECAVDVSSMALAVDSQTVTGLEGSSSDGGAQSSKVGGFAARLGELQRILSRERLERRIEPCEQAQIAEHLQRQ